MNPAARARNRSYARGWREDSLENRSSGRRDGKQWRRTACNHFFCSATLKEWKVSKRRLLVSGDFKYIRISSWQSTKQNRKQNSRTLSAFVSINLITAKAADSEWEIISFDCLLISCAPVHCSAKQKKSCFFYLLLVGGKNTHQCTTCSRVDFRKKKKDYFWCFFMELQILKAEGEFPECLLERCLAKGLSQSLSAAST